jgi:hypothetical protein
MLSNRVLFAGLVFSLIFLLFGVAAWGLDMNEGDWEVTMDTTMQGMPEDMPPVTYTTVQCMTKDDMAPRTRNSKNCEIRNQSIVGNTVTWNVLCEDGYGKSDGKGQITFNGDSYHGEMNMQVTSNYGSVMTILTRLKGRYLGPCSAATRAEAEKRRAAIKDR